MKDLIIFQLQKKRTKMLMLSNLFYIQQGFIRYLIGYSIILTTFSTLLFFSISSISYAGVDKSGLRPNVLSLPSGPGSIEGLGESFESQLNNGTSSYRVSLNVPPGRNKFSPQLQMVYDSGKGNSVFGLGWNIGFPYISRQTNKGLPFYTEFPDGDGLDNDKDEEIDEFDEFDTFVYSGKEELVPTTDNFWRCENESAFIRFEKKSNGWIARRKDGIILKFGSTLSSRVYNESGNLYKWCIDEMIDTNNNKIRFIYEKKDDSAQIYLSKIKYNQLEQMTISFNYEKRPDIITDFRPRFELKTAFRCQSIVMYESKNLVRSYRLKYALVNNSQPLSLLTSVTTIGGDSVSTLPPASFEYVSYKGELAQAKLIPHAPSIDIDDNNIDLIDINGDALPDIIDTNQNPHGYYMNLGIQADGSIGWSNFKVMKSNIQIYLGAKTTELADMDGNLRTDIISLFGSNTQLFVLDENLEWLSKGDIEGTTVPLSDPNVKLLDANNDRFIDLMQTTGGFNTVWICLKGKKWSKQYSSPSPDQNLQFNRVETRISDMNGDRIMDLVYLSNEICYYYPGKGYGEYASKVQMSNSPVQVIDNKRLFLADVNGDGMSDAIHIDDKIRVWLNIGLDTDNHSKGKFADPFTIATPYVNAFTAFRRADINGNGSLDIILNTSIKGKLILAYIDFAGGEQAYLLKKITNGIGRTTTINYRSSVEDLVRDRNEGKDWKNSVPIPIPIVDNIEINDGQVSFIREFRYHDGYYDAENEEFRGFERSEQREIGDISIPDLVVCYKYDTGKEKDVLKGKILYVEAGVGPATSKWPTYDGKDNNQNGSIDEEDEFDPVYILYREENIWNTKKVAENKPEDERRILFPYISTKKRDIFEKGNGKPVSLKWEFVFDNYGNLIKKIEHGRTDKGWDDERITKALYTSNYSFGISNWLLDKIVEQSIEDEKGQLVSKKRNYYDNLNLGDIKYGNLTSVEDWVFEDKFIVSIRYKYDEYGNIIAIFDPLYGKEEGHYREIEYDDVYHTFPVKEIIYTGNKSLPTLTMFATYNYGFGVVTCSKDFNGYSTQYNYDIFGRLTSIVKPPDRNHTIEFGYVLAHKLDNEKIINWVETRIRDGSPGDGFLKSRIFYDGLGRKIMTRMEGEEPGQIVVSDTVKYNARKNVWKKYLPYFENSTLDYVEPAFNTGFIEYFYDELEREIRANQPVDIDEVAYKTTNYEPLVRIVKDEEQTRQLSKYNSCGKRYIEDGLQDIDGKGRIRKVYEIVKLSDTGESIATPIEWLTSYNYNLLDKLTRYIDSQNNQKIIEYDGLGRKILINDPDRGKMTFTYDDAGNLIRTIDAKGQVIQYEYDGVNRLINEYYGHKKVNPNVSYHYDEPFGPVDRGELWGKKLSQTITTSIINDEFNPKYDLNSDGKIDVADVVKAAKNKEKDLPVTAKNTKGFLSWVLDESGEEHNSYDERGRVAWIIKRIIDVDSDNLRNFMTTMSYDSLDRVKKLTYPDSSYANYNYNCRGFLESIPNVINRYDYNPAGQNVYLELSCGIVTKYEYDNRLRLKQLHTIRTSDDLSLQKMSYTYDGVSNIVNRLDERTNNDLVSIGTELGINSTESYKFNVTQSFIYDSLYRLKRASNPTVYGTIDFRYDRIGNMIQKDASLNDSSLLMNLGAMTFGGKAGASDRVGRILGDGPGPHAVTEIKNGPEGPITFIYDENGNMISERGNTLKWDFKDRLIGLENKKNKVKYIYDYTGNRKKKTINYNATGSISKCLYIDRFSEIRNDRLVKYVYAANNKIARENISSKSDKSRPVDPTCFFLFDHLGSTNIAVTNNGNVVEQIVNFPYGYPRQIESIPSTECSSDYIFTGKELDNESDLYYFDSRFYNPVIGRFISVDPGFQEYLPSTDKRNFEDLPGFGGIFNPVNLNLYNYAANNPIKYIDPDGKKIRFAKNATPKFKKQFEQIVNYLKKGKVYSVIDKLEQHPKTIFIKEGKSLGDFYYNSNKKVIVFHPKSGLKVSAGKVQTPALGVLHEAGHALQDLENPAQLKKDVKTKIPNYHTKEEKRVIEKIETPAATKLGEPIRKHHGGKPVKVSCPTCNK